MNLSLFGDMRGSMNKKEFEVYTIFRKEWNNEDFINFRKKVNSEKWSESCIGCVSRQNPMNYS